MATAGVLTVVLFIFCGIEKTLPIICLIHDAGDILVCLSDVFDLRNDTNGLRQFFGYPCCAVGCEPIVTGRDYVETTCSYANKDGKTHLVHCMLQASGLVPTFNDPKFGDQFYLSEKHGVTMNIYKAWNKGYTGKRVIICIHDPAGVDKSHLEYASKFTLASSYDYNTNTSDPKPETGGIDDGAAAHGTKMAGIAAAKANNGICGVGVAYDAIVSGIKLVLTSNFAKEGSQKLHAARFAETLKYRNDINDIFSCSWSSVKMYEYNIGYMSSFAKAALKESAEKGRAGKGNIYVFSAGNGGPFNGSCSFAEYVNSIYTIGISVVTGSNAPSRQNNKCSAISAVTYSRDNTMGLGFEGDLMPTCGLRNTCVKTTGASSAATAVASGVFALMLDANTYLNWRDVQHLIARSSCSNFDSVSWKTNKANITVSDEFGFGLLDAYALTENAKTWKNAGPQLECSITNSISEPIHGLRRTTKTVDLKTWPASCGGEAKRINFLEHVVLQLSLNFTLRKNIEVEVISPGGTKSIILRSGRLFDVGSEIKNLSTMSLHFWGEDPRGEWKFNLRNTKPNATQKGELLDWSLKFYGTAADPMARNTVIPSQIRPKSASTTKPKSRVTSMAHTSTDRKYYTVKTTSGIALTGTKENSSSTKAGMPLLLVTMSVLVTFHNYA